MTGVQTCALPISGAGPAAYGLLVAALVPLALASGPRLAWAMRGWSLAVCAFAASAATALGPLLKSGEIGAFAIDPWDKPGVAESAALDLPFPMLFSPLNTNDGHDWSEVLDLKLGQAVKEGPPMPIVYVVDKAGLIVHAGWGWQTSEVLAALTQAK